MRRPGSQGPSSGGLFSAIGLRWGVSFGFVLLLTLIVDAPLWWNEAAEETNLSTWSQRREGFTVRRISVLSKARGVEPRQARAAGRKVGKTRSSRAAFLFHGRQMPTDDCLGEQLQACRDEGPVQQQVPGSALFRSDRFSRRRAEGGGQRARSMVVTERLRPRPRRTSRDQFVTPPPSCLRSQTRGPGIQSGWGGEPQPASTALVVPFLSHARCMWHPACRRKEAFQIAGRITARHTTQCSSWRAAISEI